MRISLVEATKSKGWPGVISKCHLPGRLAFFVFQVNLEYSAEGYFPGLEVEPTSDGYLVAGTLDRWDAACYALLNNSSPHDCVEIYRFVHRTISGLGFRMSGVRTTKHERFYLR